MEDCGRKIKVVYGSNGNDAEMLRLSISSVSRFLRDGDEIFVLTTGAEIKGLENVRMIDTLEYEKIIGLDRDASWKHNALPYASMIRLCIPLMPQFADDDMILYLDTDTIMAGPGLLDFFRKYSGSAEFCGAVDPALFIHEETKKLIGTVLSREVIEKHSEILERLGKSKSNYINSGVLIFNLSAIRKVGIDSYIGRVYGGVQECLAGRMKFCDQDIVNAFFCIDSRMPYAYNSFATFGGEEHGELVHWAGDRGKLDKMRNFYRKCRERSNDVPKSVKADPLVEDLMSRSFVIALNGSDRLAGFYDSFKKSFPGCPLPRWYRGIVISNSLGRTPALGIWAYDKDARHGVSCTTCQYSIVAAARAMGWPSVTIFEDDARPSQSGPKLLKKVLHDLPDGIKVLKLGSIFVGTGNYKDRDSMILNGKGLLPGDRTYGAFAVTIFKDYYDEYLETLTRKDVYCDLQVLSQAWGNKGDTDSADHIYRLPANAFDHVKNCSQSKFYEPALPWIENAQDTYVITESVDKKFEGAGTYPSLHYRGGWRDCLYECTPSAGFFKGILGLCSFAHAAGLEHLFVVTEEFAESGKLEEWKRGRVPGKSRIMLNSFGMPEALDIAHKDFFSFHDDIEKYKDACNLLGRLQIVGFSNRY